MHTPLRGDEELALHAVTSHCWSGEAPPWEHSINSAHTLYSGWKLNKNPLALAGHVEGRELVNSVRSAPVPEVRAVQNLGGAAEHRTGAGAAVWGPHFVSRGWRVVRTSK